MPKKKKTQKKNNDLIVGLKSEKNFFENLTVTKPQKVSEKKSVKIMDSHRIVYDNYEKSGFRHLGKAIREAGTYSETIAASPHKLTKTKSWRALMDEKMPEAHLAKRHREILDKRETRKVTDGDGNVSYEDVGPNVAAVTKGLELAYRLRGSFKEQETPPPSTVMYNLFYKPEVRDQMKIFEEGIRKSLYDEVARKNQKDIKEAEEQENLRGDRVRDAEFEEKSN